MVTSITLDPTQINLDLENPRFSLFNFTTEDQVIDYLVEFEEVRILALQIIKNGYNTLGERIIALREVKEGKEHYIVLEGNRRIAALKCIFSKTEIFNASQRKKIESLNKEDFYVDCDIVTNRDDALFKITSKHIDGIKSWSSIDKLVFYYNLFQQYKKNGLQTNEALNEIEKVTPESKGTIRNSIKKYKFLSAIHEQVKPFHQELTSLSHLDNDVLTSRVLPRLKQTLDLSENDDYEFIIPEGKREIFNNILRVIGEAAWIKLDGNNDVTLNTRTFNTKNQWETILADDIVIPGLNDLIQIYLTYQPSEEEKDKSKNEGESNVNPSNQKNEESDSEEDGDVVENEEKEEEGNNVVDENYNKLEEKYRIFIENKQLTVTTENYNLLKNIVILDENNSKISKSSSVYNDVQFSCDDLNIILDKNYIRPLSENGKYNIKVNFFNLNKNFDLILSVEKIYDDKIDHYLFTEEWYKTSVALLSSNPQYKKIVSALNCFYPYRNLTKNSADSLIVISFLIRIIVEQSSKAFWDAYSPFPKKPSDLPGYISQISTYLYQNDIITKEEKKAFANGSDLEALNGQIHDYRATLSSLAIESIFESYQNYLDKVFAELNSK